MNDTLDPVTHKPRLLARQCATCIGRPGNKMKLRPGRLRGMIAGATGPNGGGIVCHETLSYGQHPEVGESYCRWFYDTYGHLTNYFRICNRFGGFTEVEIPDEP